MYQVFLGAMGLPIAPAKIETVINSRNTTIELINGQEVNILKSKGLTQIQFEFMIPSQNYPFMTVAGSAVGNLLGGLTGVGLQTAILEQLENLKESKTPFQFIVARLANGNKVTNAYNTNIKVTLEDYTIVEDANNGTDLMVSVRLLQYVPYSTKVYNEDKTVEKTRSK